nr:glycohydrolase toxin TNT-related protein [Phascolarctobacterium succinatutens]
MLRKMNDAPNENKENSLKNVELKNNNFDKTKVKNNTVNRFKDFLSKNNKLDSNTDNKNSTGKDIPSIKNQILKTPDKTIKHSETNVDRFDQNKGMKEFLDGKRDLVKKNTEAKAENKSEAKVEKNTEAKVEKYTEAKVENKSEAKAEKNTETKAENKAEAKVEKSTESKAENKSEAKVEKNTEAKVEKYTEAKVENKSEAKAEKNTETKAENKAEAKVEKSTEAKVENKSEAKAEKNTEAKVENKSETKAENKSEAKAENKSEAKAENKSEAKAENKDESKVEKNAEAKAENKSETKAENKSEAKAENKDESKVENKSETKAENKSETKAENKSEAKAENKSENKVEKNAEAKVENKAEANDVTNKHQDINIEKQQLKNNNILNRNDTKNNQINRFKNFLSENNKIDKNIDNKDYRSNDVSSIKNQILQTPERMPNPLKINEDRVSQNNNEVNVENNAMKYFVKKHNTDVKNNEDVMVVKSDLKSDLRKALENDLNTNLDSNDKPKKITDEMIDNIYKNYLDYLEQNTSYDGKTVETNIMEYTDEEIRDIAENDRGYINERAMKTLPAFELNNNTDASVVATNGTYLEFGFQRGLDNWKPDKVPGTEKIIEIEKGKVFDRYGNENGSYMTDAGTEFKDLHMIVSEDKVEAHTYEVVKSFKANSSNIASQDFDDYKPEDYNEARQYIALDEKGKSLTIKDLLEQGYIREVKGGENSVHDAGENVKDVKYNDSYMDKTNNGVSMMEYIDALYKKSNVEDTDSSDEDNNIDNNISLQKNKGVERVRSWTNTRSANGEAISSNLNYSNETKNKNILTNDDINRQRQIIEDFKHSLKVYNEEKAKDDADEWER